MPPMGDILVQYSIFFKCDITNLMRITNVCQLVIDRSIAYGYIIQRGVKFSLDLCPEYPFLRTKTGCFVQFVWAVSCCFRYQIEFGHFFLQFLQQSGLARAM